MLIFNQFMNNFSTNAENNDFYSIKITYIYQLIIKEKT